MPEFEQFTDEEWAFFEAAAMPGLDAPFVDGDAAEDALSVMLEDRSTAALDADGRAALRNAFEVGWNVATENGANELARKFARVRFAAEGLRADVSPAAPGLH